MRPQVRLFQTLAFALALAATGAGAIDNPDAPDRIATFEARVQPYEQRLGETDGGSRATQEGVAYARFLDTELNRAYQFLLTHLDARARAELIASQRIWLRFRDAEFAFIDQQWTAERNGSSAALSVADYRTALVKNRVYQLLQYGAEFP